MTLDKQTLERSRQSTVPVRCRQIEELWWGAGRSCLRSTMTPDGPQTIERRFHTNQLASGNGRCDGSSRHGKLNSSFRSTVSF